MEALRALVAVRDEMLALARERLRGPANAADLDLLLHVEDGLAHYAMHRFRPPHDRFHPIRESPLIQLARRGGTWQEPRLGMLSNKFLEQYHALGSDLGKLVGDARGVGGAFALTSRRGDFRYDLTFSGETQATVLPEFRLPWQYERYPFSDWLVGGRERLQAQAQRFAVEARERRGWILTAVLPGAVRYPAGSAEKELRVFAWVDNGVVLRGWANTGFNRAYSQVETTRCSVQDKRMEVGLRIGFGSDPWIPCRRLEQEYVVEGVLEGGDLDGRFSASGEMGTYAGEVAGRVYQAYVGRYQTEGVDGAWSGWMLAGIAPAPSGLPALPGLGATGPAADQADAFADGVECYRQILGVDWALREPGLPLADALERACGGFDDRWRYYPDPGESGANYRNLPPALAPDMLHRCQALSLAGDPRGAATAYLARLARTGRQALAERRQNTMAVVGMPEREDPDFGPFFAARLLERHPERGNLVPASGAQDWRLLGDWSCGGFIPRTTCFESGPYLPELHVEAAVGLDRKPLDLGACVRLPVTDVRQHAWSWRADPAAPDWMVRIPRQTLQAAGRVRGRWGGVGGPPGTCLDGDQDNRATWYASTRLTAARAGRVWMAVRIDWDGRLWVNERLIWQAARHHTSHVVAVIPVDLAEGENRVTVCCSPRRVGDGNSGKWSSWVYKYAERAYGGFAVWLCTDGAPRPAEAVTRAQAVEAGRGRSPRFRGRRGDGSGRYPDARPPLAWDLANGANVRWKTTLPTDDAEPAIVGDRLFLTTYAGELACLDKHSGAEIWRRRPQDGDKSLPREELPPSRGTAYDCSSLWQVEPMAPSGEKTRPALERSCLTPVADTQRVWMHDPRGTVACFDHQGRQVWARTLSAQVPRQVSGHYDAVRLLPPTHPAAIGDRLVVAAGAGLTALDLESGKVLWTRPELDFLGQFALMQVGDGPHGNLVILGSCAVLDAGTGETLIEECAPRMPDGTCQPVVEGQVAYLNAAGAAVRFWLEPDGRLGSRLLWDAPRDLRRRGHDLNHCMAYGFLSADFFSQGGFPPTPVLSDGLLYTHQSEPNTISHGPQTRSRFHAFDAQTGCAVSQRSPILENALHPATSTVLAGGYLFAADEGGYVDYAFRDYPVDVPQIAVLSTGEGPTRLTVNRGLATLAPPVFDGRRIYLAGSDQVVCIERPEALGDRFSPYEIEALKTHFLAKEIGTAPMPPAKPPRAIAPLPRVPAGATTAVAPLISGLFPQRLLGAWPLPAPVEDPWRAMSGLQGTVVVEGTTLSIQGTSAAFRPMPAEALVFDKSVSEYSTFNVRQYTSSFGLVPTVVFGGKLPATAYAFALLSNQRTRTLELKGESNTRCWLAGHLLADGDLVRVETGLYPFLVEMRGVKTPFKLKNADRQRISPTFAEVEDPEEQRGLWVARVRAQERILRAIAESGGSFAEMTLRQAGEQGSKKHP